MAAVHGFLGEDVFQLKVHGGRVVRLLNYLVVERGSSRKVMRAGPQVQKKGVRSKV
jgi:hypothetical protein